MNPLSLHLVLEGLLGVEPEGLSRLRSPRPTRPLLRRRFRDGGDKQRLHPDSRVVNLRSK